MADEYNKIVNYVFSGLKERMGIKDKVHYDGSKILARRGRDDGPQEYNSKEKVKTLCKRRIIQRNNRKRLNNLI